MRLTPKWTQFVEGYSQHGDQIKAYQDAYPKAQKSTARVKAHNLMQKPEIQQAIKEQSDLLDSVRMRADAMAREKAAERLVNKIVGQVLKADEKKEILRQIATGELKTKMFEPYFDEESQTWKSKLIAISEPSMMERMKAIEVHNKMTGDNSPEQVVVSKGVKNFILED